MESLDLLPSLLKGTIHCDVTAKSDHSAPNSIPSKYLSPLIQDKVNAKINI